MGREKFIAHAIEQAKIFAGEGVERILIENENDHPYRVLANDEIINCMSEVCFEVKEKVQASIGVEFLINDPISSLKIAQNAELDFIRTDYFVDRMYRDEYGELEIYPDRIIDFRNKHCPNVKVYTDIQVKYAKLLEDKTITSSCQQAIQAKSDGLILSSTATALAPNLEEIKEAAAFKDSIDLYIGSGLSADNLNDYFSLISGAFVGSSMMDDGIANPKKVKKLIDKIKELS